MRAAASLVFTALALIVAPASAPAQAGSYEPCDAVGDASVVQVSGAGCDEAIAVAQQVVDAPAGEAGAILRAAGWSPLRAEETSDEREYDVVATRGLAALRVRRPGDAPDLDGWMAGRELLFARPLIVGGQRPPSGSVLCTSAFLLMLPGNHPGGLTAAHCGGVRRDGTTHRRYAALRRPPQPGIVLGRVRRNLARTRPLDALVLPVPSGPNRPSSSFVDRGATRPPWPVAGFARPLRGRKVCYAGRTSGPDRCGEIAGRRAARAERLLSVFAGLLVRCTTITAQKGDSGGPVYTAPRADGTVRAVGITTLVVGDRARMCFTPLGPVLDALDAQLVTYTGATVSG